jgi:Flp pilus assembly protein TadD
LSADARARYEAQMKTLRAQIDAAKWQEALATAEAMNKERPREPQARFLKTLVLAELGRDDEAKRELLALVADYPELPEPRNNLATLYAKNGEYDLARRELELALAAVPDYGTAHANLADLYLQQAIEHYRRAAALAKNSGDSKVLMTRADAIQTLLAPKAQADKTTAPPKDADAAKNEKEVGKDEKAAAKEDEFLLGGCGAPPGFGGKDDDDDLFSGGGGTCDINFDEPEPEKKEGGDQGSEVRD